MVQSRQQAGRQVQPAPLDTDSTEKVRPERGKQLSAGIRVAVVLCFIVGRGINQLQHLKDSHIATLAFNPLSSENQ